MTHADNAWRVNARLRASLRLAAKPASAGSREQPSSLDFCFCEAAQTAFVAERSEELRRGFSRQPTRKWVTQ